ncbi:hypothetical protein [Variovorax sp. KBW07]|uniref:hypothetical protein n=1 Tax=Variovorax sp. KBW07 TaxID=2153358 RepID=UPI000F5671CD|nr:hypothetical protein [Variovorax sp. KBW07]
MTRNEVVLSASESDDGESGHLALQMKEVEKEGRDSRGWRPSGFAKLDRLLATRDTCSQPTNIGTGGT